MYDLPRSFWLLASLLFLAACGDKSTGPAPVGPPTQLVIVVGSGQSGPVGARLPLALTVRVSDAAGAAVPGVAVSWSAAAGTLSAASSTTNAEGQASVEWTLGTQAGAQNATATVTGMSPLTFTATATPGAAAQVERMSGNAQSGTPGATLPDTLVVRVTDAHGNPVGAVGVGWSVSAGGGTLLPVAAATGATGLAKAQWVLGATLGQNTATAAVANVGSVGFTATVAAGVASNLEKMSGDGQSAAVGTVLPQPLVVRVMDGAGNPVAGTLVTWSITHGNGTLAPFLGTTNAQGLASTLWTLGTTAGANAATASAAGQTVSFTATAQAGSASNLQKVSGDTQAATVGATLPAPLVVRVTDAGGNPVTGASVQWNVTGGGGTISPQTVATDGGGVASSQWTLGTAAGANSATASAAGATVGFTAMGNPGPTARVSVSPASLTLDEGETGQLSASAFDQYDNPITGRPITWQSSNGGVATVSGSGLVTAVSEGTVEITAQSEGRQGSATVTVHRVVMGYRPHDLGSLGGFSVAMDINDHGDVVGYTESADGVVYPFVWNAQTGVRILDIAGRAVAINNQREVVLSSSLGAHVWSEQRGLRRLVGLNSTVPYDINNNGVIVGASRQEGSFFYFWNLEGHRIFQGGCGAETNMFAINDNNVVVGEAEQGRTYRLPGTFYSRIRNAMRWTEAGGCERLISDNVYFDYGSDISNNGSIAGGSASFVPHPNLTWLFDLQHPIHATVWLQPGAPLFLTSLGGARQALAARAESVNNRGDVAGRAISTDDRERPVVWLHGQIQDLGTVGGAEGGARSINSGGDIVGWSLNSDGAMRATLWTMERLTSSSAPGAVPHAMRQTAPRASVGPLPESSAKLQNCREPFRNLVRIRALDECPVPANRE